MVWQMIVLAAVAASAPTLFYIVLFWWLDRYEKEPLGLLLVTFFWGVVPAALLTILLGSIVVLSVGEASRVALTLTPLIEELVKGIALVGLYHWRRAEFHGLLDGITYGAFVGLGFAMTENFFAFIAVGGPDGLGLTPLLIGQRSIVFGLNHPLFSAIYGAGLGWARYRPPGVARQLVPMLCLILAGVLHLLHNFLAQERSGAWGGPVLALVGDWGGLLLMGLLIAVAWVAERRWLAEGLLEEVQLGYVTSEEFQLAASQRRRVASEWRAWRHGGWRRYWVLSRQTQALTKLAFAGYHARHNTDQTITEADLAHLRAVVLQLRHLEQARLSPAPSGRLGH